jgi:endonuclease/exonuclease/phosphatase (EEP) superfamily protein YafD
MCACALGLLTPVLTQSLSNGGVTHATWVLDLAAHWQWLSVAALTLGLAVAFFVAKRCLFFALLLPLPWWTASPSWPLESSTAPLATVTVASANVHLSTTQVGALAQWLAKEQPDLVVLLEVSRALGPQLASLTAYFHQVVHADDSPFGIALLSKWPLTRSSLQHDADGIPRIEAEVQVHHQAVQMVAFHPMPPLSPHFHQARDQNLKTFAQQFQTSGQPGLVVGDLNATPWSSAFAGLAAMGLRRTTSLQATWPTAGQGWLGIPIDHVLATRHWKVLGYRMGPDLGSDHLPVLVQLALNTD